MIVAIASVGMMVGGGVHAFLSMRDGSPFSASCGAVVFVLGIMLLI